MTEEALLALGRQALLLMLLASLPPVGASCVAGLLTGLFQVTTQLQDSALSFVPRLCAAALALAIAGPWIAAQLSRFATLQLLSIGGISP